MTDRIRYRCFHCEALVPDGALHRVGIECGRADLAANPGKDDWKFALAAFVVIVVVFSIVLSR